RTRHLVLSLVDRARSAGGTRARTLHGALRQRRARRPRRPDRRQRRVDQQSHVLLRARRGRPVPGPARHPQPERGAAMTKRRRAEATMLLVIVAGIAVAGGTTPPLPQQVQNVLTTIDS